MPIISPYSTFPVAMGFGTISIMGSTPAALVGVTGNNGHWMNATKLVFQDYTTTPALKTYDTGTLAVATVDTTGANLVGGGGSIWAAWLVGSGVRTSVGGFGPLPLAGLSGNIDNCTLVSETGQVCVVTNVAAFSGLTVYTSAGAVLYTAAVTPTSACIHLRQNILSYQDASGWHLVNVLTGQPVPNFQQRPNVTLLMPFTVGTSVGVMEYQNTTDTLTIRLASQLTGLTIPTVGTEFNPDIQGTGAASVRLAYSLTVGEQPEDLIILDINTLTGTTEEGTVVAGSVVFAAGPTLAGSTFSGSTSALNTLPVQSQKVLNSAGEMSKPWRDALQRISGAVQAAGTAINNLPITTPPDGFGDIGGVTASGPDSTLTLTSVDGSVTITPDQSTSTIDLSVQGGFCYVPMTTGAIPGEILFVGPNVMLTKVPVL